MIFDREHFASFYFRALDINFIEKQKLNNDFGQAILFERGLLLYSFAQIIKARTIVETGTANGFSAVCFAKAMKDDNVDGAKIHTIDYYGWGNDYSNGDNAKQTVAANKLEDYVCLHEGRSLDVLPSLLSNLAHKIDIAHIDSEHDYDTPKNEFEALEPFLKTGAYIFFHDTDIEPVRDAVSDILGLRQGRYDKIVVPLYGEMTILRKLM